MTRPHAKVVFEGMIAALQADSNWKNGFYTEQPKEGLAAMGRVYAAWGFSQAYYLEQLYQQEGYETLEEYLVDYWDQVFLSFDANDLISMLRTGITGNISANSTYDGDFELALSKITARALVMPGSTDLFFLQRTIIMMHYICQMRASSLLNRSGDIVQGLDSMSQILNLLIKT